MIEGAPSVSPKVKWVLLGEANKVSHYSRSVTSMTFIMEVAGGCLVKEVALSGSNSNPPGIAMNFIIGAKLSDFTDEPPSA